MGQAGVGGRRRRALASAFLARDVEAATATAPAIVLVCVLGTAAAAITGDSRQPSSDPRAVTRDLSPGAPKPGEGPSSMMVVPVDPGAGSTPSAPGSPVSGGGRGEVTDGGNVPTTPTVGPAPIPAAPGNPTARQPPSIASPPITPPPSTTTSTVVSALVQYEASFACRARVAANMADRGLGFPGIRIQAQRDQCGFATEDRPA